MISFLLCRDLLHDLAEREFVGHKLKLLIQTDFEDKLNSHLYLRVCCTQWLLWLGNYGACDIHFTYHILSVHRIQSVSLEILLDHVLVPLHQVEMYGKL